MLFVSRCTGSCKRGTVLSASPPPPQAHCESSILSTQLFYSSGYHTLKTRFCLLYSPLVNRRNRFNNNVISRRYRVPARESASSLFSSHPPYLILLTDQRQEPSPSASLYSGNEAGHAGDAQGNREGRVALNVKTALTDSGQAAENGNSSDTYWNLYLAEAEISDKDFVESLEGDTKSMELVVRLSAPPI
jgi:hypothetical protein